MAFDRKSVGAATMPCSREYASVGARRRRTLRQKSVSLPRMTADATGIAPASLQRPSFDFQPIGVVFQIDPGRRREGGRVARPPSPSRAARRRSPAGSLRGTKRALPACGGRRNDERWAFPSAPPPHARPRRGRGGACERSLRLQPPCAGSESPRRQMGRRSPGHRPVSTAGAPKRPAPVEIPAGQRGPDDRPRSKAGAFRRASSPAHGRIQSSSPPRKGARPPLQREEGPVGQRLRDPGASRCASPTGRDDIGGDAALARDPSRPGVPRIRNCRRLPRRIRPRSPGARRCFPATRRATSGAPAPGLRREQLRHVLERVGQRRRLCFPGLRMLAGGERQEGSRVAGPQTRRFADRLD